MKHIFIFNKDNPFCLREVQSKIYSACINLNYDFEIVETGSILDIQECARKYRSEDVILYGMGGECINSIILNEIVGGRAQLGFVPLGFDLDFYRSLDDYQSSSITTSVMKVNEIYAINNFTAGIVADFASEALERHPLMPVGLTFFNTLRKYRNKVIGVNDYFEKMFFISVCNGAYFSGGIQVAQSANINRPEVTLIAASDLNKLESFLFCHSLVSEKIERNSKVNMYQTDSQVHLEGMYPFNGLVDGNIIEAQEFDIVPHEAEIITVNNRQLIRELKK